VRSSRMKIRILQCHITLRQSRGLSTFDRSYTPACFCLEGAFALRVQNAAEALYTIEYSDVKTHSETFGWRSWKLDSARRHSLTRLITTYLARPKTTPSALHGLMYADRRPRGTRQWRPQMLTRILSGILILMASSAASGQMPLGCDTKVVERTGVSGCYLSQRATGDAARRTSILASVHLSNLLDANAHSGPRSTTRLHDSRCSGNRRLVSESKLAVLNLAPPP